MQQSKHFRALQESDEDGEDLFDVLKYCKLYGEWRFRGATKDEVSLIQECQLYLLYNVYDDISEGTGGHSEFSVDQIALVLEMACRNIHAHALELGQLGGSCWSGGPLLCPTIFDDVFLDCVDGLVGPGPDSLLRDAGRPNTKPSRALMKKYSTSEIETPEEELIHCVFCIFNAIIEKDEGEDGGEQALPPSVLEHSINVSFIDGLVNVMVFNESKNKRELAQMVLVDIYKFAKCFKAPIRSKLVHIVQTFVYDNEPRTPPHGMGNVLGVLLKIAKAFRTPLYREKKELLYKLIIPLHLPARLSSYGEAVVKIALELLWKAPECLNRYVRELFSVWPVRSPEKKLFLQYEVECLVSFANKQGDKRAMQRLFSHICESAVDVHFQIALESIGMFEREEFVRILAENRDLLVPMLVQSLLENVEEPGHWHSGVRASSGEILAAIDVLDRSLAKKVRRNRRHAETVGNSGREGGGSSDAEEPRQSIDSDVFQAFSPKRSEARKHSPLRRNFMGREEENAGRGMGGDRKATQKQWWFFGKKAPVLPAMLYYVGSPGEGGTKSQEASYVVKK